MAKKNASKKTDNDYTEPRSATINDLHSRMAEALTKKKDDGYTAAELNMALAIIMAEYLAAGNRPIPTGAFQELGQEYSGIIEAAVPAIQQAMEHDRKKD